MTKPLDTQALLAAAKGQPAFAAQIYAASLLAIEVDTPAEKKYLDQLAADWGLNPRWPSGSRTWSVCRHEHKIASARNYLGAGCGGLRHQHAATKTPFAPLPKG